MKLKLKNKMALTLPAILIALLASTAYALELEPSSVEMPTPSTSADTVFEEEVVNSTPITEDESVNSNPSPEEEAVNSNPTPEDEAVNSNPSPKDEAVNSNPSPEDEAVNSNPSPEDEAVNSNPSPEDEAVNSNPTPEDEAVNSNPTPEDEAVNSNPSPEEQYDNEFKIQNDNIVEFTNNGRHYRKSYLKYMFDGDPKTHWETRIPNKDNFKNTFTVTFDQPYELGHLDFLGRQGGNKLKGFPTEYKIYYTENSESDDFKLLKHESDVPVKDGVLSFYFEPTKIGKIKFEFVEAHKNWAAASEVAFYKYDELNDSTQTSPELDDQQKDEDLTNPGETNPENTQPEQPIDMGNYSDYLQSVKTLIDTKVNNINKVASLLDDDEFKSNLITYEFLTRLGEDNFNTFQNNVEFKIFFNDMVKRTDILNGFLIGRDLNYNQMANSVKILKNIWENDEECHDGFYLKLAIATAQGHASPIRTYDYKREVINPVIRYNHYKDLYKQGKLFDNFDKYDILHLSMIVDNPGSENDIDWMQEYIRTNYPNYVDQAQIKRAAFLVPYGPNKRGDGRNYRDTKWTLEDTLSMAGVCGRLSHFGSIATRAFGAPSTMIDQPGHRAFLHLESQNSWQIGNNIGGLAGTKFNGETIVPWGNNAAYMMLMEEASLDQNKLEKSQQLYWLSNIVSSSSVAMDIRDEAIDIQPLYYFAWEDKLSELLKNPDSTKEDFKEVSFDIMDSFYNHPKVMDDLLKLIEDKITDGDRIAFQEYITNYNNALNKCEVPIQQTVVNKLRNQLNENDMFIATFSFSGENAYKLMGTKTDVEYSLDGGETYTPIKEENQKLTASEIESLTSEHGILLRVKGAESSIHIPLKNGPNITKVSANDELDMITRLDETMEFSIDGGKTWTKYQNNIPDLSGNLVIDVRKAATGNTLFGEKLTFTFTENTSKTLIDYSKITVANASSEKDDFKASNAIDNNQFSVWKTTEQNSNKQKFITLKLDEQTKISRLDYLPELSSNNQGNIRKYVIYTSLDGINFTKVATGGWGNNKEFKTSKFAPVEALYVKLEATYVTKGCAAASIIRVYQEDKKPVINAKDLVYKIGDEINLEDVLKEVTATDLEDGDLSSKVTYKTNYVEDQVGEFSVTYSVKDSYGNITEKVIKLKVREVINQEAYLSDIKWTSVKTDRWGMQKDKSLAHTALKLFDGEKEVVYEKGLGVHSSTKIVYDLTHRGLKRFTSFVGVDRSANNRGSVQFKVLVDDKVKYTSSVMYRNTKSQFIDIDIEGAETLTLIVTDGGNGGGNDSANWADAKLIK